VRALQEEWQGGHVPSTKKLSNVAPGLEAAAESATQSRVLAAEQSRVLAAEQSRKYREISEYPQLTRRVGRESSQQSSRVRILPQVQAAARAWRVGRISLRPGAMGRKVHLREKEIGGSGGFNRTTWASFTRSQFPIQPIWGTQSAFPPSCPWLRAPLNHI